MNGKHPAYTRLAIVVCLAVAVRWGASTALPPERFDADQYQAIATTLVSHHVFATFPEHPTAFRPPLYPFTLALLGPTGAWAKMRIVTFHIVLTVLTVVITFRLAHRLGAPPTIAATIVALDPILIRQSTFAMTETLAALLAIAGVWALIQLTEQPRWSRGLASGILIGLACLCRPTFLIWGGLVACVLSVQCIRRSSLRPTTLMLVLGIGAMIGPWVVRNAIVMGHPIIATTHGGYTLWLGNNADFYEHLRTEGPAVPWDSAELDARFATLNKQNEHDERGIDRECYSRAKSAIRADPSGFVIAVGVRVARLFQPIPNQVSSEGLTMRTIRYGIGIWYLLIGGSVLAGLWKTRRDLFTSRYLPGLLLVVAFIGLHAFYWCNMRMRAPLMPWLAIVAAAGWTRQTLGDD
ncbi:MAG: glycosyltransferase family 39 protein [Pirellulaceae bacterium]